MSSEKVETSTPEKQFAERMLQILNGNVKNDTFDIDFIVGENPIEMTYRAHKVVLAAGSDVFHAMFYGALKEPDQQSVRVPDVDIDAFSIMLKHLYGANVTFSGVEEACQVLYAAKKYLIDGLHEKCREFIKGALTAETVCEAFGPIKAFEGEDKLAAACLQILVDDTDTVISAPGFLASPPSLIGELVDQEVLNIESEYDLIVALLNWSEAECQRRNLELNGPNQLAVLKFVISKLRFLSLTPEEFTELSKLLEMFPPKDYYTVISNITSPLPGYICLNKDNRCYGCQQTDDCKDVLNVTNVSSS